MIFQEETKLIFNLGQEAKNLMQSLVYSLLDKFFMNQIENKIIHFLDKKRTKIIFDVGCFKGNFTKNFIKNDIKLGLKSYFYMFDPNPNVKKYIKSLLLNQQIKYFSLALDNSNSEKKFYLNNFFEPSGSSLNTLVYDDKKWINTRRFVMKIFQPFKKLEGFSEINVMTKTLDLFCEENKISYIDLLKIDAEGNEKNIFYGSKKLLTTNKIHAIYVEITATKINYDLKKDFIFNYLKEFGFDLKISLPIRSFSFLSNLRASDNLLINRNFEVSS